MHCRCLCWFVESIDHWSLRPNCNFVLQNCRLWKKGTCVNNISRPGSTGVAGVSPVPLISIDSTLRRWKRLKRSFININLRWSVWYWDIHLIWIHLVTSVSMWVLQRILYSLKISREVQFGHAFASFIFPDHTFVYQLPWRSWVLKLAHVQNHHKATVKSRSSGKDWNGTSIWSDLICGKFKMPV